MYPGNQNNGYPAGAVVMQQPQVIQMQPVYQTDGPNQPVQIVQVVGGQQTYAPQTQYAQPQQVVMQQAVVQPSIPSWNENKVCRQDFAGCYIITTLTFLAIFCVEFFFVLIENINRDDAYASHEFFQFMTWLYVVVILITAIFVAIYFIKKLWITWRAKKNNFVFSLVGLFAIWIIVMFIGTEIYKGAAGFEDSRTSVVIWFVVMVFFFCPMCICICF